MARIFNKGERPPELYSRYHGDRKFNQYFYLRVGTIEFVDEDKYEMTIAWRDGNAAPRKIPVSFPYAGPGSIIGMLPERGAVGIFGFTNEGEGKGNPLCIGYLPAGLNAGLNYNRVKVFPESIPTTDVNNILYRFRKLAQGDMILSSPLYSTIFLNDSVEIHDASQDSILIRDSDQSIITTSLNNFLFADGALVSAGPAIRNFLEVYDKDGKKLSNNGSILSMPNGKDNIYIVPNGEDITYETEFYSEYRIDVDELGNGKLDTNEINSSSPLSSRDPLVTFALGNYIGANRFNPQQYGLNLKARLFASKNDRKGSFGLEQAITRNGVDEPSTIGLAYALHFLKSDCFIGVDKEGHHYMHLPASKTNPLGAGRSMSILAQGNLKEIWGSSAGDNNSWDLSTNGGVIWDIGAHGTSKKSRSFELRSQRGIYIEVSKPDDDGYARREEISGNTLETVSGDMETVTANMTLDINGLLTEKIGGSASESVQSDKTVNVQGVYTETAIKEKQCKFGTRKTTITSGNDELEVTRGNIEESITTFGKKITNITSGNIEQNIKVGDHKTSITTGNYEVDVSAGKVSIKTSVGSVEVSGTSVKIEGDISIEADAPIVKLGGAILIGGVVSGLPGKITHYDYVTGSPLQGSLKVSVG